MLDGDEMVVHIEGKPDHVKVFEIGCTWITTQSSGEHAYYLACRFKGLRAGESYRVIARLLRARDCSTLRLEKDLHCTKDADEFESYFVGNLFNSWRPK